MTYVASPLSSQPRAPILIGLAGLVLLLLIGFVAPRPVLHGWMISFLSVGGIALGAFAWQMMHRLTGGQWGELARPALALGASLLPLLALFWVPLWIGCRLVYPWGAGPGAPGRDVAALFLNGGAFAVRNLVGLAAICGLAWFANNRRFGSLGAGLSLLAYVIFMNFAAFDWLLSLDPHFTSSSFGAQLIVQQLVSGLAFVAVVQLSNEPASAWKDVGALLLATSLGQAYLALMAFIVFWYGDLPDQAAWYLRRTEHGWLWLELAILALGAIGPIIALLFSRVRNNAGPLRVVAVCLLAGVFLRDAWLVAPTTEPWSIPAAVLAAASMLLLGCGLSGSMMRLMGGSADGR